MKFPIGSLCLSATVVAVFLLVGKSDFLYGQEWIGSQSCASATCHGGGVDQGEAWHHSYSLSRSADPHATAGALLYDADSRRIVKALAPGATTEIEYDLALRTRCISCHLTATPADVVSQEPLSLVHVGEGVGCESCHGPAGEWKDMHVLESWTGPMRFQPATGMLDTESITGRAEGCVRCHVGSRSADGIVRDMNHDLIAAGHPALRFDLLIYNDNIPHHWDDTGIVEKAFGESSLKVRRVGRSIGLAAAAKLSSERALASLPQGEPSQNAGHRTTGGIVPWPELSDFDCFACHQSLSPKSYRAPETADGETPLQVSNGLPLWNAWFSAMDSRAGDVEIYNSFKPKPGGNQRWSEDAEKIASRYRVKASEDAGVPASQGLVQLTAITNDLNKRAPADWHAAAMIYLDLQAALQDLALQSEWKSYANSILESIESNVTPLMRFPDDAGSAHSLRLRSPKNFDPRDFRSKTLAALGSTGTSAP